MRFLLFLFSISAFAAFSPNGATIGAPKRGIAELNCDATASVVENPDSLISSVGNQSGAICSVTLTSGYFSTSPYCRCSRSTASGVDEVIGCESTSSTNLDVQVIGDGGAAEASNVTIACTGGP